MKSPAEARKLHQTALRMYAKYLKQVRDFRGKPLSRDERTLQLIGFDAGWRAAANAYGDDLRSGEGDTNPDRRVSRVRPKAQTAKDFLGNGEPVQSD